MKDTEHWIAVADRSSVGPDSVIGVKAGDLDVALYNIDGQIYATHNICTHAQALLSEGWLDVTLLNALFTAVALRSRPAKDLVHQLPAI